MRQEPQAGMFTWGVIIVVTCLILYLFERVMWLAVPGFLTLVGYYCLQPLVQSLVRSGLKHRTAVKVVTGLLFLVTVGGVALFLTRATTRATAWQAAVDKYMQGGLNFLRKTDELLTEKLPLLKRSAPAPSRPTNPDALKQADGPLAEELSWLRVSAPAQGVGTNFSAATNQTEGLTAERLLLLKSPAPLQTRTTNLDAAAQQTDGLVAEKLLLLKSSAPAPSALPKLDEKAKQILRQQLAPLLLQMIYWLPSLLLVPYLTYFMLQDGNRLKKHLIGGVPNAFFEKTLLLVDRVDRSLQGFLIGVVKLTFLDTVCLGLGLWLLRIHYPFVLGLIAAVLAWVPYVGSVAGCVLVTLVAATDFPTYHYKIYNCIGLFICVRLLDDFVFLPLTVGRSLQFHPVLSVLMLFVGAAVAGPTGLLFVLPVLGVVAVIIQTLDEILTDERLRARHRHARQLRRSLAQGG
jgi:predicted PurR-regulated permease PerM